MLALIAVGCFVAHGIGWRRELGFELAAALLVAPALAAACWRCGGRDMRSLSAVFRDRVGAWSRFEGSGMRTHGRCGR